MTIPCRSLRIALLLVAANVGILDVARADESLLSYAMAVPREDEADTLRFTVFQVERYDSNFFRLPDGINPNGNGRRSAVTSTSGVGVGLDKTYGQQRFTADAAVTRDFYSPYGNLDFTGHEIRSAYYWTLTPSFTGSLSFDRARLPTEYEFTSFRTESNPRTRQTSRFDADWQAGAALHPRFSIYESEDTTQDPTFQQESYKARNAEVALIYKFKSENTVQVYARGARGNNTNANADPALLLNNDFTEREYGVLTQWKVSGLTSGELAIGRFDRSYTSFNQRDFNGLVGHLNIDYILTGKTTAHFAASRSLNSSQTTFSSYYEAEVGRASVDWQATGKIKVRPVYQFTRQIYRGSPFPVTSNLSEITRDASLQVELAALRALDLSLSLTRSSRDSNDRTLQFVDRSASIAARFKF